MRTLTVVGLDRATNTVVCVDSQGEKFALPADEKLRAAARGDIPRLGQIEIALESSLRPREIQARIRAGATVAEVAALAGVDSSRIERFAHPVLLERRRAAELASTAHPVGPGGVAENTLAEVVADAMVRRNRTADDAEWDAWRGEDGRWVVEVSFRSGRSTKAARWRYLPGSHGGVVQPLNELADHFDDPAWQPTRAGATAARVASGYDDEDGGAATDFGPHPDDVALPLDPPAAAEPAGAESEPADAPVATVTNLIRPDRHSRHEAEPAESSASESGAAESTTAATTPEAPADSPAPADDAATPADDGAGRGNDEAPAPEAATSHSSRGRGKPAMPSWEDVLLGVRGNGER